MNEVKKALRPVKRRLRRNRFLRGAAAGLAAGLGAALLLQAVSFFVPVADRGLLAAAVTAAVTVLAAFAGALRPVRDTEAAKAADACGLKERAITALEGGDEPVRILQRRDACEALAGLNVKQIRPGSFRRSLLAALGCAALLACLLLIPNPRDEAAEARKALTKTLREGREAIARAAEEDEAGLTEEEKSELRKITGELDRELEESRDAADALVALDRAEQRMEDLRQKTAGEAAAAAEDAAGENESRTGENRDQGGSAGENGTAGQAALSMDGQQLQTASAGDVPAGAQMKTLQALAALQAAVIPSAWSRTDAQTAVGMQGSRNGQGGSSANGTGAAGSGRTGGGAGEGSTNEEETGGRSGNSNTHAEGSRTPKYKEEQYETIYDPEHISKAKQDTATDQYRLSDEDSLQLETGPGWGSLSGDVPWDEALREYADTEARAADRENLTVRERQWVDEYYRLLTEQQ